jgi:hypothetical protein
MFSHLQLALCHSDRTRIRLTQPIRDQIKDFWELAQDITFRPTSISKIIPTTPTQVGACDAAKAGAGGVWLPPDRLPSPSFPAPLPPLLWRTTWPAQIQSQLLTDTNPRGTLTNSDLELAGTILHQDVITSHTNCREATTHTMCDNVTAVTSHCRGSVTTDGPGAYLLLRLSALHQRHHGYLSLMFHIPGTDNTMADDCSRMHHLSDSQLLAYFDLTYPQTQPWKIVTVRPAMLSAVHSDWPCSRRGLKMPGYPLCRLSRQILAHLGDLLRPARP